MRAGRYELSTIVDARFGLDGGVLFGVVPRTEWGRVLPPDADNRIQLAARCLVAVDRGSGRVILVDTGAGAGPGAFGGPVERAAGEGLEAGLERLGLRREDVTDVLLSGLQRVHAGGVTRPGPGGLALAFPRATHHVQRHAWQAAHAPSERDVERYAPEALAVLVHSNQLHLVDGEVNLFPDVELVVAEGPSPGHQLPRFKGAGAQVTFCGDLVPTHAHVRAAWAMATDSDPVTALEEKKVLLAEALEEDGVLVLAHDPLMAACRLGEDEGHPAFREAVEV